MRQLTRTFLLLLTAVVLLGGLVGPAGAADARHGPFPDVIALPDGWRPEGIATGLGPVAYVGSLGDGAIYRADLRTGQGDVLVPGVTGRVAVGLKYSRGLLYVAGGATGAVRVYDARSGAEVLACQFATPGATFINDVVVTRDAAWFTDSLRDVLYRLPIERGRPDCPDPLPPPLRLTGDWEQVPGFNANGIEATASGRTLIVVNTALAALFTVDPRTGEATRIDSDVPLSFGDGLLLRGRELFVVQNRLNSVAVLRLSYDLASATLVDTLTDPALDVPTTAAAFGRSLYLVNARFTTPPTPDTAYAIVRVDSR